MSLVEFWKSSREQIENKTIEQLIAFAGGGKQRDGNDTPGEFRRFLSHIPSGLLQEYVDQCLGKSFTESGYVLQDIVNQVGERLGFDITYGRYQGSSKEIGFDGVWKYPNGHNIIVEIKTTDAYRIDLNKIADYRASLSQEGKISEQASSILIIVGRNDTGDLEAQIRGSRHAWDMRLISIDALLSLLRTKEELEDPETVRRIYELLIPREFTKLDEIIELVFSTAEEAKLEEPEEEDAEIRSRSKKQTKKTKPVSFNDVCAARIED